MEGTPSYRSRAAGLQSCLLWLRVEAGPRSGGAQGRGGAAFPRTRHVAGRFTTLLGASPRAVSLRADGATSRGARGPQSSVRGACNWLRRRCRCRGTSEKSGAKSLSPPPRPPLYGSPRRPDLMDPVEPKMPVLCPPARRGLVAVIVGLPDGKQRLYFSSAELGASWLRRD